MNIYGYVRVPGTDQNEDRQMIVMGKEYWFWQGAGYIFVAVIYVIRYFLMPLIWGKYL